MGRRSADAAGQDLTAGMIAIAPILLGVAPFAFVAGAISVNDGASVIQALAFSVFAFAGASQIASLNLLAAGAPVTIAVVTATVVNLRFLLYSATLSPILADSSLWKRLAGSYLLTDHAFAVSMTEQDRRSTRQLCTYYLGAALAFWLTWQCALTLGAVVGGPVTHDLPVQYLVSLSFLALLIPMVRGLRACVAVVAAASCMSVSAHLFGGAAALISTCFGVLIGQLVSRIVDRRRSTR